MDAEEKEQTEGRPLVLLVRTKDDRREKKKKLIDKKRRERRVYAKAVARLQIYSIGIKRKINFSC